MFIVGVDRNRYRVFSTLASSTWFVCLVALKLLLQCGNLSAESSGTNNVEMEKDESNRANNPPPRFTDITACEFRFFTTISHFFSIHHARTQR